MTKRRGRKAGGSKPHAHASHSHAGKGDVAQEQANAATSSSSLNDAPRAPGVERQLGPSHANGVQKQKRPRQVLILIKYAASNSSRFLASASVCVCV